MRPAEHGSGLCWLLPDALYRATGQAESVQDPREVSCCTEVPDWPVLDGPASCELDASLRPLLPRDLVRRRREDYGDAGTSVAATILYSCPRGGSLRVTRRRLAHPLLLDAVCDPTRGRAVEVLPTGSAAIRADDDAAHHLVLVRPDGMLFVIDSIGLPARGVAAPLSREQLDHLASDLDDPSAASGRKAEIRAEGADLLVHGAMHD